MNKQNIVPAQQSDKPLRHFLDLKDFSQETLRKILDLSKELKKLMAEGQRPPILQDQMLAMVFERESTRTRVSFDVGMRQLGGQTLMLTGREMQLSRDETIADTARVLSRYVDAIIIRILSHDDLLELAGAASVPVINGLTHLSHPCQVMADIQTYEEHRGPIEKATVTWVGDANNVLASWVHATTIFGNRLNIACPNEYAPSQGMLADIAAAGDKINLINNPQEAAINSDLIIADTWVSMGDKDASERRRILSPYRVDKDLMDQAKSDALFMHCLPAHRGDEVSAQVMDGPQSVVFDEAENRLHIQKAILAYVFDIKELS